ncbi:phospholipase [Listeria monocytogenes]|uniref:phosphatidylcholine phospholipase C n=1 Tax=Listeria monocytogenes TaxID=1639 RepID=UPI00083D5973|nr:phosphatidylcholine phospholipase C [Listeria monocytogenes]ODE89357.1 phospholipase [Listeria monocytogenes]ODE93623.1 phospholipase [Listeria monocytogenes]ODE97915.1 phospholipase [Listeria monocytogenes]HAC2751551.1 phospholipase [Listeria monocytogenes]
MKFKKVVLGMCLTASVLVFPVTIKASACCDEYLKPPAAPHDIDSKLPHKLSWSADNPTNTDVNTHYWLFKQAEKILAKDVDHMRANLMNELKNFDKQIAQGIYDADHKNPYYDTSTFLSHFYNPDKDNTYLPGFANAKITGAKYFNQSVADYREGKFDTAFYKLGLAIHYYTDISQPMHANNFTAISYPPGYHCAYENYVDSIKHNYQATEDMVVKRFCSNDVKEWLYENAKRAKADYPKIVNAKTKKSYLVGNSEWKKDTVEPTGARLRDSQQTLAGFLEFWSKKTNE